MGINQMLARGGQVDERIPAADEFTGPAAGRTELPNHLCWSGSAAFDVSDPGDRLVMYTTLIGEGQRSDLARWVHWEHLVADWPKIRKLTAGDLIKVWERLLPDLARA